MLAPREFGIGAVPPDASPELIAFLRIFGGPMLGIAVLNWMARNAEPSTALNAIVVANLVGFGCVMLVDVWGVFIGGARPIATLFLIIQGELPLLFVHQTLGFIAPGLIVYQLLRQPPAATLVATGIVSGATYAVMISGILAGVVPAL